MGRNLPGGPSPGNAKQAAFCRCFYASIFRSTVLCLLQGNEQTKPSKQLPWWSWCQQKVNFNKGRLLSIPRHKFSGLVEVGEAGEVAREATPPTNPQTLHSFRCLIVTFQASCVKTPFNFILLDAHPSCLVQETRISPLIPLQPLKMCTFVYVADSL